MALVSVQRGQTTLTSTSATAAISGVVLANSWVNVIGVRANAADGTNEWRRQQVDAELNSTTQVTFRVAQTPTPTGGIVVEWEVVSDTGLSVQRGRITSYTSNPGNTNISITAVTLLSTWIRVWGTADGGGTNSFFLPTTRLTTTTNLNLFIATAGFVVSVSWQVIEDTEGRLTVRRYVGTVGTGTTVDISITAVASLAKSFVRLTAMRNGSGNAVEGDTEVHGFLFDTTTLRWERSTTAPGTWNQAFEVIESTEIEVQRGQFTFGSNATVNTTISGVVMDQTFVMMGQSYPANARSDTAGNIENEDINTTSLTSMTNVQGQRVDSTDNGVLSRWEVVRALASPGGFTRKVRVNPVRPVLQRNHPLANGLVMSCCFGWVKGYRAAGGDNTAPEDRTKRRGDIQGANIGAFKVNQAGRNISGGDADDRVQYENGPNNQLGNMDTIFGTAMMVFQPDSAPAGELGIFTKRVSGASGSAGWSIQGAFGGGYEFELSDGTNNADSQSGPDAPYDTEHPQIVVGRCRLTSVDELIDLWVDGTLRGSDTVFTITSDPGNFQNVELFGYDGTDGVFGQMNMGAVYNRLMPIKAVQQHHVDPYAMWRWPGHKQFFQGPGAVLGAQFQTYFHAF